jgi:hypothetical protein
MDCGYGFPFGNGGNAFHPINRSEKWNALSKDVIVTPITLRRPFTLSSRMPTSVPPVAA